MQAQKGRTKSALLIWTKSDLSDKVFNRYFTIWPRFGTTGVLILEVNTGVCNLTRQGRLQKITTTTSTTGYFRFGPIWSDLVIRVTATTTTTTTTTCVEEHN